MVPVSWPPWPASITMRPILSPSARVNVDWPSRVGSAAFAGWIKSGFAPSAFAFFARDLLAGVIKLELRGAGSAEAADPPAVAAVLDTIAPPPSAGAGGPK